jgi:hypothetical protein
VVGKGLSELFAPAPNSLIGDDNAPLRQKQLDISRAEAEHVMQPDGMRDDLGEKAGAVARVGGFMPPVSPVANEPARACYRDNAFKSPRHERIFLCAHASMAIPVHNEIYRPPTLIARLARNIA